MTKKVKTNVIIAVYSILANAKYGKMSDDAKIKMWKIMRKLKPIAQQFEEDSKDCADKMKPTEDFFDRLRKWQEYNRLHQDGKPTIDIMTTAEHDAFTDEYNKYNQLVGKAMKESSEREVSVDFDPIDDDALLALMESNDWTLGQVAVAADFICE